MKRRALLQGVSASVALLTISCAAPLAVATRKLRLGVITGEALPADGSPPPMQDDINEGLRGEGYVDGKNMTIEFRHTQGNSKLRAEFVGELVGLPVDILIGEISGIVLAMKAATNTIPIVMSGCPEPIELGLIQSYARPRGSVTGMAFSSVAETIKRLELLHAAFPAISRVLAIGSIPGAGGGTIPAQVAGLRGVANSMGVELSVPEVLTDDDVARALSVAGGAEALLVIGSPLIFRNVAHIMSFAAAHRLPAVYPREEHVAAGGLMSFGYDRRAQRLRVASYVRRISEGASPGDLPVELASKFAVAVNLVTAARAGLSLPVSVMTSATTVIR